MASTQETIVTELAQIIEEVTGIEPSEIGIGTSFVDDLGIDSLSMVEIAVQTEDKYNVKIPDEDLMGLPHRRRRRGLHPHPRSRGSARTRRAEQRPVSTTEARSWLGRAPQRRRHQPRSDPHRSPVMSPAHGRRLLAGESGNRSSRRFVRRGIRPAGPYRRSLEGLSGRCPHPGGDPADELAGTGRIDTRAHGMDRRRLTRRRQGSSGCGHRHRTRRRRRP